MIVVNIVPYPILTKVVNGVLKKMMFGKYIYIYIYIYFLTLFFLIILIYFYYI